MLVLFPDRVVDRIEVSNLLSSFRATEVEVASRVTVIPLTLNLLEFAVNAFILKGIDHHGLTHLLANDNLGDRIINDFIVDTSHPLFSAVGEAVSK